MHGFEVGHRTAGVVGGIYPSVRLLTLGLRLEVGRVPILHPKVPDGRLDPRSLLPRVTTLPDQVIVPDPGLFLPQVPDGLEVHAELGGVPSEVRLKRKKINNNISK